MRTRISLRNKLLMGYELQDEAKAALTDDAFVDAVFPILGEYFSEILPAATRGTPAS